jgi:hypothetical protein
MTQVKFKVHNTTRIKVTGVAVYIRAGGQRKKLNGPATIEANDNREYEVTFSGHQAANRIVVDKIACDNCE